MVQTCYRDDIRRLLNASSTQAVDDIDFFGALTGDTLSTLSISNNQARVSGEPYLERRVYPLVHRALLSPTAQKPKTYCGRKNCL